VQPVRQRYPFAGFFYDDEELILEPGYLNSEDFTKDVQNETEV